MFLSSNKKNNVYPCKPKFYYKKWGLRGPKLYRYVFMMINKQNQISCLVLFFIPHNVLCTTTILWWYMCLRKLPMLNLATENWLCWTLPRKIGYAEPCHGKLAMLNLAMENWLCWTLPQKRHTPDLSLEFILKLVLTFVMLNKSRCHTHF